MFDSCFQSHSLSPINTCYISSTLRILLLRDLPIYSRREAPALLLFNEYNLKLFALTERKFICKHRSTIEEHYCAAICKGRERIFDLVGQDKYIRGRSRSIRKLLRRCSGDRYNIFCSGRSYPRGSVVYGFPSSGE